MAKITLEGVVVSVHREKRLVEGTRTAEELEELKRQNITEADAGPKLEAVDDVVARVAVAFPGGARPEVFAQFAAPIEVWGVAPTLSKEAQTVEVTLEISGL